MVAYISYQYGAAAAAVLKITINIDINIIRRTNNRNVSCEMLIPAD